MTREYIIIVSAVASEMERAMRYRMDQCGDCRPLYVYVSPSDGGWTIGHDGQHSGYWRSPSPITCGDPYPFLHRKLSGLLTSAPLFAGMSPTI